MHEIMVMQPRHGVGDRKSESQERLNGGARADHLVQRLGLRALEHQHRLPAFAHELKGPQCPGLIDVVPESIFMGESTEGGWRRILSAGLRYKDFATRAVRRVAPHPAVEAVIVHPQDVARYVCPKVTRRLRRRSHGDASFTTNYEMSPIGRWYRFAFACTVRFYKMDARNLLDDRSIRALRNRCGE